MRETKHGVARFSAWLHSLRRGKRTSGRTRGRSRAERGSLVVLAVGLSFALRSCSACGECVAELRFVEVGCGDRDTQYHVEIARVSRFKEGEASQDFVGVPQDAVSNVSRYAIQVPEEQIPDSITGTWLYEFVRSRTANAPAADAGTLSGASRDERLCFVEILKYDIRDLFSSGKWWVSYIAPSPRPSLCEFWLRYSGSVGIRSSHSADWDCEKAGGRDVPWNQRWILTRQVEHRDKNEPAWVLAGTPATWDEVGNMLLNALAATNGTVVGRPGAEPTASTVRDCLAGVMLDFATFRREPPTTGFGAKTIDRILRDRAGNCKDLSRLLAHKLNLEGFRRVYMVFHSSACPRLHEIIPCPYLFDHVSVALAVEGGTWFMDPFVGQWGFRSGLTLSRTVELLDNQLLVTWDRSLEGVAFAECVCDSDEEVRK